MPPTTRIKRFSDFLQRADKRIMVCYGGAGSGKSRAIAIHLCQLFLTHSGLDILVVRKTRNSIKDTCMALIASILRSWEIPIEENLSGYTISFQGSTFYFRGMDDPEKIKSFNASLIWIEEATQLAREDFLQLMIRLRKGHPDVPNQIFLSFNPISSFNWCIKELVQGHRKDIAIMHSTWRDNPFLPPSYIEELESLKDQDMNHYRIYALGEPGVLEGVVYTRWRAEPVEEWPEDVRASPPDYYGLDFGFNHPTSLVGIWNRDEKLYVREYIHMGMTITDLIERMRGLGIGQAQIAADPSGAGNIEDLCRAGFNVHKANNSVKEGIDCVRAHELIIDPSSVDLLDEIRNYVWKKNKSNEPLDEPVKFKDHAMDALRYGSYTFRTQDHDGPVPSEEDAIGNLMPDFFSNDNSFSGM